MPRSVGSVAKGLENDKRLGSVTKIERERFIGFRHEFVVKSHGIKSETRVDNRMRFLNENKWMIFLLVERKSDFYFTIYFVSKHHVSGPKESRANVCVLTIINYYEVQ